jgi:hypothetical protein
VTYEFALSFGVPYVQRQRSYVDIRTYADVVVTKVE